MDYKISKPTAYLSQYVKQYWELNNCLPSDAVHTQRIIPSGLFELIFYLDHKPQSSDPRKDINDNIILTGQLKNYHDIKITGNLSLFAIYFLPHGLSMFLEIPINELFNQSVPLRLLIKDKVNKLEDDLLKASNFERKIAVAENFLRKQIQKNERKYHYERIRFTVNKINQAKGVLQIEDLASTSFLSRKQFERTFLETIGITPKQFLKIVRFQNAIYVKSKNSALSLTEIAHNCGYFDQSHMINDFRTLAGISPKQYFETGDIMSDYFE